jgi:hypothetical protein
MGDRRRIEHVWYRDARELMAQRVDLPAALREVNAELAKLEAAHGMTTDEMRRSISAGMTADCWVYREWLALDLRRRGLIEKLEGGV